MVIIGSKAKEINARGDNGGLAQTCKMCKHAVTAQLLSGPCVCGLPRAPQSGEKGGGRCISSNPAVNINTESKSSANSVDTGYFTVEFNVDTNTFAAI